MKDVLRSWIEYRSVTSYCQSCRGFWLLTSKQMHGEQTSAKHWICPAPACCLNDVAMNLMRRLCYLEPVTETTSDYDVSTLVLYNSVWIMRYTPSLSADYIMKGQYIDWCSCFYEYSLWQVKRLIYMYLARPRWQKMKDVFEVFRGKYQ